MPQLCMNTHAMRHPKAAWMHSEWCSLGSPPTVFATAIQQHTVRPMLEQNPLMLDQGVSLVLGESPSVGEMG